MLPILYHALHIYFIDKSRNTFFSQVIQSSHWYFYWTSLRNVVCHCCFNGMALITLLKNQVSDLLQTLCCGFQTLKCGNCETWFTTPITTEVKWAIVATGLSRRMMGFMSRSVEYPKYHTNENLFIIAEHFISQFPFSYKVPLNKITSSLSLLVSVLFRVSITI